MFSSDPELHDIVSIFKCKKEALRRLAIRKELLAKVAQDAQAVKDGREGGATVVASKILMVTKK